MGILRQLKSSGILIILFVTLFLMTSIAQGQDSSQMVEQKIKAGLVYNFLKYTTWPSATRLDEKGRLQVCLFGDGPVDDYLSPLEGRTAQKLKISILHIDRIQQTENCHMVFVSTSEDAVSELIDFLKGKPVLTISDISQFADAGGMVELTKKDEFIKIYINQSVVREAGLDINDRLLNLSETVN